jgi:hypothetical protein
MSFDLLGEGRMSRKDRRETPIERIYREVTGFKMPPSLRRILLKKHTRKRKGI